MSVIPERRLKAAIGFIFVTAVLVVAAGVGWITARVRNGRRARPFESGPRHDAARNRVCNGGA